MNARNYQKELDKTIETLHKDGLVPSLFLHSCCAPCSSYVLEYLSEYFAITVFYYNPNIFPDTEYAARVREQERLIAELNRASVSDDGGLLWQPLRPGAAVSLGMSDGPGESDRSFRPFHRISFVAGEYRPELFYEAARGLEEEPEGGARCTECFRLRLTEAARIAAEGAFDYFTTTLSISPLKDAVRLNTLGEEIAARYGIRYLNSDFKKKNGYKRSVELSAEHGLYRQNYCGCVFSRREAERRTQQER